MTEPVLEILIIGPKFGCDSCLVSHLSASWLFNGYDAPLLRNLELLESRHADQQGIFIRL